MKLRRKKISKNEISQVFDLEKILGYTPSTRQKEVFFELAVDKMVDRTLSGKDINNKDFPSYTKEYADFKGVTRSSVDLVLSGDMLDSFVENKTNSKVEIKITENQTGKAHGNISGSYGKPKPVKSKARDFFGFKNTDDLQDVIDKVDDLKDTEQESIIDLAELRAAVAALSIDIEGFNGTN